ncbi:MAG: GDSL-type esterase/lipase family protein [Candidatus Poribacteria bacterium]|nr:GDSL-type esterase/lipase family protein [Candidatus Poribacteria bacterium]
MRNVDVALKRVVCIGDSIRMGYEPTVVQELADWAQVWRMGEIQGGNTRNVLEHLDEWGIQPAPDIVHINAGLHDMARDPGPGPEPRVPLHEYRENLRQIISTIQKKTPALIIFALTTPVDLARQHAVNYGVNRVNTDVLTYNQAAREVAAERHVVINDLYQVVVDNGIGQMLREDGVHFTASGSEILGKAVAAAIRAASANHDA